MPEQLLTIEDVAERFQVSTHTIRRLVDKDELHCIRVGKQIRFTEQQVATYLAVSVDGDGWE